MFLFLFSISYSFSLCPKFLHTFVMPWRKHVTILSNYSTDKFKTTRDCLYVKTAHFQVLLGIVRPWYCKNPDHSLYFVQTIDFLGCKSFDVFFKALLFLVGINFFLAWWYIKESNEKESHLTLKQFRKHLSTFLMK